MLSFHIYVVCEMSNFDQFLIWYQSLFFLVYFLPSIKVYTLHINLINTSDTFDSKMGNTLCGSLYPSFSIFGKFE